MWIVKKRGRRPKRPRFNSYYFEGAIIKAFRCPSQAKPVSMPITSMVIEPSLEGVTA